MSKKITLKSTICYECRHHKSEVYMGIGDAKRSQSVCKASPKDGGTNFVTGEYKNPTTFELCVSVNTNGECTLYEPLDQEGDDYDW